MRFLAGKVNGEGVVRDTRTCTKVYRCPSYWEAFEMALALNKSSVPEAKKPTAQHPFRRRNETHVS